MKIPQEFLAGLKSLKAAFQDLSAQKAAIVPQIEAAGVAIERLRRAEAELAKQAEEIARQSIPADAARIRAIIFGEAVEQPNEDKVHSSAEKLRQIEAHMAQLSSDTAALVVHHIELQAQAEALDQAVAQSEIWFLEELAKALRDSYRRDALAFLAAHFLPLSAVAARIGRLTGQPAEWANRVFLGVRVQLSDEDLTQDSPHHDLVHKVHTAWPRHGLPLLTGEPLFSEEGLDDLIDQALQGSPAEETPAATGEPHGPGREAEQLRSDPAADAA